MRKPEKIIQTPFHQLVINQDLEGLLGHIESIYQQGYQVVDEVNCLDAGGVSPLGHAIDAVLRLSEDDFLLARAHLVVVTLLLVGSDLVFQVKLDKQTGEKISRKMVAYDQLHYKYMRERIYYGEKGEQNHYDICGHVNQHHDVWAGLLFMGMEFNMTRSSYSLLLLNITKTRKKYHRTIAANLFNPKEFDWSSLVRWYIQSVVHERYMKALIFNRRPHEILHDYLLHVNAHNPERYRRWCNELLAEGSLIEASGVADHAKVICFVDIHAKPFDESQFFSDSTAESQASENREKKKKKKKKKRKKKKPSNSEVEKTSNTTEVEHELESSKSCYKIGYEDLEFYESEILSIEDIVDLCHKVFNFLRLLCVLKPDHVGINQLMADLKQKWIYTVSFDDAEYELESDLINWASYWNKTVTNLLVKTAPLFASPKNISPAIEHFALTAIEGFIVTPDILPILDEIYHELATLLNEQCPEFKLILVGSLSTQIAEYLLGLRSDRPVVNHDIDLVLLLNSDSEDVEAHVQNLEQFFKDHSLFCLEYSHAISPGIGLCSGSFRLVFKALDVDIVVYKDESCRVESIDSHKRFTFDLKDRRMRLTHQNVMPLFLGIREFSIASLSNIKELAYIFRELSRIGQEQSLAPTFEAAFQAVMSDIKYHRHVESAVSLYLVKYVTHVNFYYHYLVNELACRIPLCKAVCAGQENKQLINQLTESGLMVAPKALPGCNYFPMVFFTVICLVKLRDLFDRRSVDHIELEVKDLAMARSIKETIMQCLRSVELMFRRKQTESLISDVTIFDIGSALYGRAVEVGLWRITARPDEPSSNKLKAPTLKK